MSRAEMRRKLATEDYSKALEFLFVDKDPVECLRQVEPNIDDLATPRYYRVKNRILRMILAQNQDEAYRHFIEAESLLRCLYHTKLWADHKTIRAPHDLGQDLYHALSLYDQSSEIDAVWPPSLRCCVEKTDASIDTDAELRKFSKILKAAKAAEEGLEKVEHTIWTSVDDYGNRESRVCYNAMDVHDFAYASKDKEEQKRAETPLLVRFLGALLLAYFKAVSVILVFSVVFLALLVCASFIGSAYGMLSE